ncbi:MAG: PTS sugar transporter subunit IIA [Woeseiaceae bacterium]
MLLEEIINPDAVLCNAHARSKKHCLEILSELLVRSNPDISADEIFENLIERERLGCTSLDMGVAFPHCRIEGLDNSVAALIRLSEAVDFDAADGEPVDLVFGLMVPLELEDSHHADIRMIAGLLNDTGLRGRLRDASTSSDLYESLLHGGSLSKPSQLANAQGS